MLSAGTGPVTSLGENAATSVGAGILLGGFAAGFVGLILGVESRRRDLAVVNSGYIGGLIMAVALLLEAILG